MGLLDFFCRRKKRNVIYLDELGEEDRRAGEWLVKQGQAQVINVEEQGQRAAERGEFNESMKQQAANGDPIAQNNLGAIYENGYGGVTQDYTQAADWYSKSANQGYAMAQHNLAVLFENGHGVSRDESTAFELYSNAACQGYAPAQYNLGVFYAVGKGVQKDLNLSLEWYGKAAKQGFENAAQMVVVVKQEIQDV